MTEAEWAGCTSPRALVEHAREVGQLTERKVRLLDCACCRRVWHLLDERSRHAVEVAERFADGRATREELSDAGSSAFAAFRVQETGRGDVTSAGVSAARRAAFQAAVLSCWDYTPGVALVSRASDDAAWAGVWEPWSAAVAGSGAGVPSPGDFQLREAAAQCDLARDILGPFSSGAFDGSWRTRTAVSLARRMYETRDFLLMPVLSDALADAGCPDGDVLEHCRGPGPHARGCFVADLVLDRS